MNFNEKNLEEMNTANDTIPQKDDISIEKEGSAEEKNDEKVTLKLDLSSLDSPEKAEGDSASEEKIANEGETLYYKTLSLIESGDITLENGVMLLKKAGQDGCALSWLYLGKLYSDEQNPMYNPALTFECYSCASSLGDAEGHYRLGLCYFSGIGCKKDENSAVNCFFDGADLDHAESICALGICREFGIGCEINYEMAAALYQKAAEAGSATAINNLGGCYFYGHGIEQDKEKAIELYLHAASLGNSNSECRLGICYENGDGCDVNCIKAVEYYQRAAEKHNPTALYRLALCYDMGKGTDQDFAKAFKYYKLAAAAGNADAMIEAGMMCKLGRGTKKDTVLAYKMFASAADLGISDAEYELGNCYYSGIGTVRDKKEAFLRYNKAYSADPTNGKAVFKIGMCCLYGHGTEKDAKVAYEWFCLASSLRSGGATYMKGECLYFGVGVEVDKSAAAHCYGEVLSEEYKSNEKILPCMLAYAQCLDHGEGITKDHETALSIYKKAAEYGDAEAMYLTGNAIMRGVGMKAEYAAARTYILRAARKGFIPAMLAMGIFAEEGRGIPKNTDDAILWYSRAVDADPERFNDQFEFPERASYNYKLRAQAKTEAMYRLGMLMVKKDSSSQSYIRAFEHIALAASTGYEPAQTEISKIYAFGGDLKGYYESSFSSEDAVFENGELYPDKTTLAGAMNKLGDAMFDGNGMVSKNESAAAKCYKTAAQLGNTEACYSYGWCLRHGVGVRENGLEAVKWLKLAADKGNSNAAYSYGLCCEEGYGTGIKNKREALSYYRKAAASGHTDAAQRYILISENRA